MAIDRAQLLDSVRSLGLPDGEYVVFGSGPLVVRGLREGADIDLVVTPELYERLRADGWEARTRPDGGETLSRGDLDVMCRLDFPGYRRDARALIAKAERIDGVPFLRLDELRVFKVALGRPKDQVDLDLIDQALARHGAPVTEARREQARAVLSRPPVTRTPEAEPWLGNGLDFVVGMLTHPRRTAREARGATMWGTAYLLLLVDAILLCLAEPLRNGGSPAWLVFAPVAAGIALLIGTIVGRLALSLAASGGGHGEPSAAASQTNVVFGMFSIPQGVATLVFGDGTVANLISAVVLVVTLAVLSQLYAHSFDVSVGRGFAGALVGYLGAIAALIGVALVVTMLVAACVASA
ncbi:MAG: hypothetical protein GEV10_06535 [Streptosporangiales bacterium]|nr:hypothetical protein [Streptosporangiales bacterium]